MLSKISELSKEHYNVGKGLDEVQRRQERRKIAALHDSCKKALQFADSFGIDLLNIVFRTRAAKKIVRLNYHKSGEEFEVSTHTCTTVDPSDMKSIYQLLFLLDKFAISDEFFHELSMLFPSLPRSYVIKKARKQISDTVKIERLPTPYFGAYRPLVECIKEVLMVQVQHYNND